MGTNEQRTQMVGKEMGGSSVGTIWIGTEGGRREVGEAYGELNQSSIT
jgi:hypothetical protein